MLGRNAAACGSSRRPALALHTLGHALSAHFLARTIEGSPDISRRHSCEGSPDISRRHSCEGSPDISCRHSREDSPDISCRHSREDSPDISCRHSRESGNPCCDRQGQNGSPLSRGRRVYVPAGIRL
jgi:hypothetical protein